MILIPTLNGKIEITQAKRLYTNGRYEKRLYLSMQNDRDFCDVVISREQAEELIAQLQAVLGLQL